MEDRGRSPERLITFADAVVAIAITLLALPLADIPRQVAAQRGGDLARVLDEAGFPLLGFAISFFVIARLWWAHHRLFEHLARWDVALVCLTVGWLFTIVLLAPVTALTDAQLPKRDAGAVVAIYIGVMLLSSLLLSALAWHLHRHPELTDGNDTAAARRLFGLVETSIGFAVALVLGSTVPVIGFFALFVLVITGQLGRLIWRRRHPAR